MIDILFKNLKGVTVGVMLFPFFSLHAEEAAQKSVSAPVSVGNILQIFFWLVIVVLLIVLVTWILKRFSGMNSSHPGVLRLITGIHVGQREKIALIQIGDKQILVGITPSTITKLHILDENVEVPDTTKVLPGSFAEKLRLAISKERK